MASYRGSGPKPRDLVRDVRDGRLQVAHHEPRLQPQHRVPRALERAIPACIRRLSGRMIEPVDLDDEAHLGGQQVRDEPERTESSLLDEVRGGLRSEAK